MLFALIQRKHNQDSGKAALFFLRNQSKAHHAGATGTLLWQSSGCGTQCVLMCVCCVYVHLRVCCRGRDQIYYPTLTRRGMYFTPPSFIYCHLHAFWQSGYKTQRELKIIKCLLFTAQSTICQFYTLPPPPPKEWETHPRCTVHLYCTWRLGSQLPESRVAGDITCTESLFTASGRELESLSFQAE